MSTTEQPEQEPTMEDVELPPPADFDLAAWIGGMRSTVRAITLYQRGDLLGDIEEVERQLEIAQRVETDDEAPLDAVAAADTLSERLEDLYDQFQASGVTFRVEARSPDWMNEIKRRVKKDHPNMHGDTRDSLVTATQLAGAIIQPEGITIEMLEGLEENSNAQYLRLVQTFFAASAQPPAVSVPTSRASSGSNSGRRR